MLMALRANQCVGILSDQNHDGEYIPFFGHPAGTNVGLGVIHERTGAPVLPGVVWWISPGQYQFHVSPPLQAESGHEKGVGTMIAFHRWLEDRIREHPEQWLWFHDRWRAAKRRGLVT
jgi:KDO2-lipid IV(A) lauroyltransferase